MGRYTQLIYSYLLERQRESTRIFFCRCIRRQIQHIQIAYPQQIDKHIRLNIGYQQLRHVQSLLHQPYHIHGCHQFRCSQQGIVLSPLHSVDQQHAIDCQTKMWKSGEESQFHFPNLMLTFHIVAGYIPHNRGQARWSKQHP